MIRPSIMEEGENSPSDQIYYVRPGFPDLGDEQLTPSLSRKIALQHYLSDMTEQVLISYFARLEYNYKKKYLFSASIRRDGIHFRGTQEMGNFPLPLQQHGLFPKRVLSGII